MSKQVYYQPILTQEEWESGVLSSFEVYRDLKNAKMDFPKHQIAVYIEGEIQDPTIIDDEDCRTTTFVVDIPNKYSAEWINIEEFKTREAAIAFVQQRFGADENGMVSLISEVR